MAGTHTAFNNRADARRNLCADLIKSDAADLWKAILDRDAGVPRRLPDGCADLAMRYVSACLWDRAENRPAGLLPDHVVTGVAAALGVDYADAWREEQLGPLTDRFYEIHTADALRKLGEELGVYAPEGATKAGILKLIKLKQWPPMPAILQPAGKSKPKRKPAAKSKPKKRPKPR